jgi:peptide chain release factor 1
MPITPEQTSSPLLRRLEQLRARFDEVQALLADPEVGANPQRLVSLSKEAGRLSPLVEQFNEYQKLGRAVTDLQEMSANRADAAMADLAKSELPGAIEAAQRAWRGLQDKFLSAEDEAIGAFFIEIRAGTGGEEAGLFAGDLFEMYRKYCQVNGWNLEVSDFSPSERGGFKELIAHVSGNGAYRHLRFEAGGHRVQRVPVTEAQGRIHTSAATVAVLPELTDVKIEINPKDIEESGCRGGGPGGQNVNKVETGWRILHKPSGLWFKMTEHKSQTQNRQRAWSLLKSTLYDLEQAKRHAEVTGARRAMMGSGDRSQRIRTYNFPQNRCTDHRLAGGAASEEEAGKNFNLEKILAGEMQPLVSALIEWDNQRRLAEL